MVDTSRDNCRSLETESSAQTWGGREGGRALVYSAGVQFSVCTVCSVTNTNLPCPSQTKCDQCWHSAGQFIEILIIPRPAPGCGARWPGTAHCHYQSLLRWTGRLEGVTVWQCDSVTVWRVTQCNPMVCVEAGAGVRGGGWRLYSVQRLYSHKMSHRVIHPNSCSGGATHHQHLLNTTSAAPLTGHHQADCPQCPQCLSGNYCRRQETERLTDILLPPSYLTRAPATTGGRQNCVLSIKWRIRTGAK